MKLLISILTYNRILSTKLELTTKLKQIHSPPQLNESLPQGVSTIPVLATFF